MAAELSADEKAFLDRCEEELKDRYTEKDEDFMSVFKNEPSKPPVLDSWYVSNNSGRRNDRRLNRRHHPYERYGNTRNRDRGYNDYNRGSDDRGQRGYSDKNRGSDDREQGGYRPQRNRYHY